MANNQVYFGNTKIIDLTDATATAADIATGKTAYGKEGTLLTGTSTGWSVGIVSIKNTSSANVITLTWQNVMHEPKAFMIHNAADFTTASGTRYVQSIQWDGSNFYMSYYYRASSTYTAKYGKDTCTATYDSVNHTLTVRTSGTGYGVFVKDVSFRLIYFY